MTPAEQRDEPPGAQKDAAHPSGVDMEFLRQEYFHIQEAVEKFDEKALVIKGWSVTLCMGGIGVAFLKGIPEICLLAAAAALLFWLIDAQWKSFQQAFYHRIKIIERFMRGKPDDRRFSSPEIYAGWSHSWHSLDKTRVFFWLHVALPHAVVFVFGIVLWLLATAGVPLFDPQGGKTPH